MKWQRHLPTWGLSLLSLLVLSRDGLIVHDWVVAGTRCVAVAPGDGCATEAHGWTWAHAGARWPGSRVVAALPFRGCDAAVLERDDGVVLKLFPGAVAVVESHAVRIIRGLVEITTRRHPCAVATGAASWLLGRRSELQVIIDDGCDVRVLAGAVADHGRQYRAGTRLRGWPGLSSRQVPWPRGMWLRRRAADSQLLPSSGGDPVAWLHGVASYPGHSESSRRDAASSWLLARDQARAPQFEELAWEELLRRAALRRFDWCRRLLTVSLDGPAAGRHLLLVFVLECGSGTQRAAAAGLATAAEAALMVDPLRRACGVLDRDLPQRFGGAGEQADATVSGVAMQALRRSGEPEAFSLRELQARSPGGVFGPDDGVVRRLLVNPGSPAGRYLLPLLARRGWTRFDLEAGLQRGVQPPPAMLRRLPGSATLPPVWQDSRVLSVFAERARWIEGMRRVLRRRVSNLLDQGDHGGAIDALASFRDPWSGRMLVTLVARVPDALLPRLQAVLQARWRRTLPMTRDADPGSFLRARLARWADALAHTDVAPGDDLLVVRP